VSTLLGNINGLVAALLSFMGEKPTYTDAVTFVSITAGSAVVVGVANPSSGSTTAALAGLNSGVASGTVGMFGVTSSSISVVGGSSTPQSSNTGMIVGLAVGLPVLVIIILIVIYVLYRRVKAREVADIVANHESLPNQMEDSNMSGNMKQAGASNDILVVMPKTLTN